MRLVEGIADVTNVDQFLAELDAVADAHDVTVQAFDARYVMDREHLRRAVEFADRAIERSENVARDRAVEILLYAAGRRQIDQALEIGIGDGRGPIVVLVDGGNRGRDGGGADGRADRGDRALETDAEAAAAAAVADLLEPADTLGEYDRARVREFYEIEDAELGVVDGDLSDLVHERTALLVVER